MSERREYAKRDDQRVIAVRLDLDTDGFEYRKWGGVQTCKAGDWVVDNDGDVYTVDAATFETTYEQVSPGVYAKTGHVWAERASSDGVVETKEGETHYEAGDYLVFNRPDGDDAYAVSPEKFEEMYEPVG